MLVCKKSFSCWLELDPGTQGSGNLEAHNFAPKQSSMSILKRKREEADDASLQAHELLCAIVEEWGTQEDEAAWQRSATHACLDVLDRLPYHDEATWRGPENCLFHISSYLSDSYEPSRTLLQTLIDKKADVNATACEGFAPLNGAISNNNTRFFAPMLIAAGADVNYMECFEFNRTPLSQANDAAWRSKDDSAVKLLLDNKADPFLKITHPECLDNTEPSMRGLIFFDNTDYGLGPTRLPPRPIVLQTMKKKMALALAAGIHWRTGATSVLRHLDTHSSLFDFRILRLVVSLGFHRKVVEPIAEDLSFE